MGYPPSWEDSVTQEIRRSCFLLVVPCRKPVGAQPVPGIPQPASEVVLPTSPAAASPNTWCPDHCSPAALLCPFPSSRTWGAAGLHQANPKASGCTPRGVVNGTRAAFPLTSCLGTRVASQHGRVSPSRPPGHTGTWSRAWVEVLEPVCTLVWLQLFLQGMPRHPRSSCCGLRVWAGMRHPIHPHPSWSPAG